MVQTSEGMVNKNVGGRKDEKIERKSNISFQTRSDPDQNNDHVSHFVTSYPR